MVADDLTDLMEIDMTLINNIARWEAGRERNIKHNRIIGNRKRWLAASADAARCIDFLEGVGQFEPTFVYDDEGNHTSTVQHPLRAANFGEFFSKMAESLRDYGSLTPGQEKAVVNMIDRTEARLAERAQKLAEKAAVAKHIGTVGERREFDLTVKFTTEFEGTYGYVFIHVMEDADGNVVVYKGSNRLAGKGEQIKFKATIKSHDYRDGIAQTIVNRPSQK